ncbi:MAG: RAMP superfamily CRISPR-associated protein [Alphaproteobacteria bacterium]|nr:RAMP superfamily CRISPR-associated protein [Alphaproteobacteria bacterium]
MATPLMREALLPLYERAVDAHPGLLLQRGMTKHHDGGSEDKTTHVERVCEATPGEFYRNAYERWRKATSDKQRFRQVRLALENRLFIGLTGGGRLETGCATSHGHGAPYIPGTSVKGAVSSFAKERLRGQRNGEAICNELFGMSANEDRPSGLSSLITLHDAWWVPLSADTPLVREVVTSHHLDYYGKDGTVLATDFDSPVPNAQVAVRGALLFVIEGPVEWLDLVESMLVDTLVQRGLGARTRSGYGLFKKLQPAASAHSEWVDTTIARLMEKHHAKEDDVLRGKGLAKEFQALEDLELKQEAFEDICNRWRQKGWWEDARLRGAARAAKETYDDYVRAPETQSPDQSSQE